MHEIIKGISTSEWKTCDAIANDAGKSRATVYAVLSRYSSVLATQKVGRYLHYRRKTEDELKAQASTNAALLGIREEQVEEKKEEEVAVPLKAPVAITTPQVLTQRITDITLKKAWLRQIREKMNVADKQRLDSILADYELIRTCS